jgi:murein DD-endopeptidase MepM/ murein hydrolase activator NlpD
VVNQQQRYGTPVPPIHRISLHAQDQMDARSISVAALRSTLKYGRAVWTRGARIYAIGRKEVEYYRAHGVDLARFEGIHVVASADGTIITVYRNRDLRGLRLDKRPRFAAVVDSTLWTCRA